MSIPTRQPKPVVTTEFLDRWAERERARLVRTGEREPISPMLRALVHRRDGWRCQVCGHVPWRKEESREGRAGAIQLDHIRPWSSFKAGDPACDRSDNLRTICADCNENRSNFVRKSDKPAMPIVKICTPCLGGVEPRYAKLMELPDRFDVWCAKLNHDSWAVRGWKIV